MLSGPAGFWAQTNVRDAEAGRLAAGHPVRLEIDADPDLEMAGQTTRIGDAAPGQFMLLPRINDSGTFMMITRGTGVRIDVPPPDTRLKPGMMVEEYVNNGSAHGFWS